MSDNAHGGTPDDETVDADGDPLGLFETTARRRGPRAPRPHVREALQLALESLPGVTGESLCEMVGVAAETLAAMTSAERAAMWTPPRVLTLIQFFELQADAFQQHSLNLRGAVTALRSQVLEPQLIAERGANAAPAIVLAPSHPRTPH